MSKIRNKILILLCLVLNVCITTAYAYNGNLEDITLSVAVERKVRPDLAYVNYSLIGNGATSKLATDAAAVKAATVKKALLKNAITSDMLEQVSYHINPIYNDKRKIIGYKAVNNVKVRVDQIDKLGDIIDSLTAGGADNIGNIGYTLKNREAYQELLLQDAIHMARKKAAVIAQAGGRNLGRMLTARINSYTSMPRMANAVMLKSAEAADTVSTVIEHREIELRADVETAFALE